MSLSRAKLSSQGQISIPAEVRRVLGISPGDIVEFNQDDGRIILSRAREMTFADLRGKLFPGEGQAAQRPDELDRAIMEAVTDEYRR